MHMDEFSVQNPLWSQVMHGMIKAVRMLACLPESQLMTHHR